ncbi:hypothetical protein EGR_08078 [Echinococcus granulosus]|uniref:Uncharacterized protein n=1 Tax=Echinococcus granulosus TaxID=6210 RepID=W6UUK3_ECHGR|nr:hypothetical protein EGR_08078 [Echinococcus granulosus]EUB57069.1 hypothetical protein EGR_08078 [Echinococcus granulosus]
MEHIKPHSLFAKNAPRVRTDYWSVKLMNITESTRKVCPLHGFLALLKRCPQRAKSSPCGARLVEGEAHRMLDCSSIQGNFRTLLSVLLTCAATVQSICQFPEFLLLSSTNIWWSSPLTHRTSQYHAVSSSFFAQLTVRGDLRKMILSYPVEPSPRSTQYFPNQYSLHDKALMNKNSSTSTIHVDLRCQHVVDKATETYAAELLTPNFRFLYICMRFQIFDRSPLTEVFELIQGEGTTTPSDCATSVNNPHRSLWIPNLSKYVSRYRRSRCPIVGGFQAKNFIKMNSKSQICTSSVYATVDSECIRGEGIEMHFNEPGCNPFESTLVTKFMCFVQWVEMGNVNTILFKEKSPTEYIVASMFYQEAPTQVDTVNNEYGSFAKVYIGLGIFRPTAQSTKDGANVAYPAYLYDLEPFDMTAKTSPAAFYEVQMRGAFGVCDDELEQCERGCNADARNRLFCRRSCPSAQRECSMTHSDSCEINASYRGFWLLIDPLPSAPGQSEPRPHLRKLIDISDRTVTFANVLGDETFYEFSCLREASEIVPDWYILEGRELQPGCHPRDVCLEVYQNRPIFSNEAPNTNTLLFRLSKSEKQGVDVSSLCTFPDDSGSMKQRRPQILVRQFRRQDTFGSPNGRIFNTSKCEIYQIKLQGSIRLRAQFFSNLITAQAARQFNAFTAQGGEEREAGSHLAWSRTDSTFLPEMVSCGIELSDFNPRLGTTGEFDGLLRLKSSCSVDPFSKFTNTGKFTSKLLHGYTVRKRSLF